MNLEVKTNRVHKGNAKTAQDLVCGMSVPLAFAQFCSRNWEQKSEHNFENTSIWVF